MATTLTSVQTYQNFINGEWVPAQSGETFENRNPADDTDVIGTFPASDERDVNAAIASAEAAADAWRHTPAPVRGEILFKAAHLLEQRKEEYAQQMTREMGKVLKETRGDVQEAIDCGFYYAGEGRRLWGHTAPSELKRKFGMYVRQPVGMCALITPWNFPMAIPSWKLFPALIAGNTCVIKPASDTPLSVKNLVQTLHDAGVPAGVVNMVTGSGSKCGNAIINDPRFRLLSFTGSSDVGRHIAEIAGKNLKKCSMEMGGKNPLVVMDDAKLELALEGAVWAAFGTTGQRCTAASRIIVHEKVYDRFKEEFIARTKAIKVGDGLKGAEMGPCVNKGQRETVQQYVQIGIDEGAHLATGGHVLSEGDLARGWFHEPTIFTEVDQNMRIAQEEIFGPVTALIKCRDLEDAISIVNNTEFGLSCSLYTQDVNRAFNFLEEVYFGIAYINAPTIGAEVHYPFGGTRNTGNGHREAAETALDIFTEWKTMYIDYSGVLQKAQIDHPSVQG